MTPIEQALEQSFQDIFGDLPLHEFAPDNCFCIHCGVPEQAVVDGIVIKQCGTRAALK